MNPILLYIAVLAVLFGGVRLASEAVDRMDPFDVLPEDDKDVPHP